MVSKLPTALPGLGIDLVEIPRFTATLERGGKTLRDRMFTPAEQAECARRQRPEIHLAARFAAKEAAMKVIGTGWSDGVGFLDFEVHSDGATAPRLSLSGRAAAIAAANSIVAIRLSLSHTEQLATAIAIAELD